jgi:kumamolisin
VLCCCVGRGRVVRGGPATQHSGAFGVELTQHTVRQRSFRVRSGAVTVPDELAEIVEGVLGLDDRPQARSYLRRVAAGPARGFTPPEVARLYDFPTDLTGAGECIGIIELGGGFDPDALSAYFSGIGVSMPQIEAVSVNGADNAPRGASASADEEVALDVVLAGGIAPAARIAVYFAPNNDRGFFDALTTAIHDRVRRPSVISISWGASEEAWTLQAARAVNEALKAAAAIGVTVCCATGDRGSSDGGGDGFAHVAFPASSPFSLACGGTRLIADGDRITSEVVWNDGRRGATGGGVSDLFEVPSWQINSKVPRSVNPPGRSGRGIPDVASNASPETGYRIPVGASTSLVGGTSAVAPLWAGLVARLNQAVGSSLGYINPLLYQRAAPRGCFRDLTEGTNGAFAAAPGWDACSGLGVVVGDRLLASMGLSESTPRGLVEALKKNVDEGDGAVDEDEPFDGPAGAREPGAPSSGPWRPIARDDG